MSDFDYAVIQQGDTVATNIYNLAVKTETQKNNLPVEKFGNGSTVLVRETGNVYMLWDGDWGDPL